MVYELPPFRPPSEAYSMLLRVTRGCPWNRCTFCGMYKTMRFEKRPVEDVKADIDAAREFWAAYRPYKAKGEELPRVEELTRQMEQAQSARQLRQIIDSALQVIREHA